MSSATQLSPGMDFSVDGENLVITTRATHAAMAVETKPTESLRRLARFLSAASDIQAEEAAAQRPALLKAMMLSGIDPVPAATIDQARRLARQRERLLASGAYTTDALRELRGDATASATRTWIARHRAAGDLFTVTYEGAALAPALQFDHNGVLLSAIAGVLGALGPTGLGGWETWTWFSAASAWLGGATPVDVLAHDVGRVVRAAERFASNAV